MATALGNIVDFLIDFGFFDVILPFLLVFTVIFGILEKTRVFGEEQVGDKKYPKKSLNSMVAFVIAFFSIAAKEVVASLQVSLPQVALVLVIIICFMLLAGSFMGDRVFSFEGKRLWVGILTTIMFFAILFIFMNSLGWLDPIMGFIEANFGAVVIPVIFLLVTVGTVVYVVGGKGGSGEEKPKEASG
ncbi:hypothetical protein HY501_02025 [Candidatus Woesearchaeota archaeon]|nr:hypothetical protein [Candidatus Woesearchaeota archaeon]